MIEHVPSGTRAESLVVVSNRLPYNLPHAPGSRPPRRNVGGLVNALEPALAQYGGAWIGWDGNPLPSGAAVAEALARPLVFRTRSRVELHGVPLSEREVSLYYHGFSNRALWPLFHDFPGKVAFSPEEWSVYERVNRRFAEAVALRTGPGCRVWVHDFHLMLVPRLLRELGFRGPLNFFLHVPFPAPEIFRALPWRSEVLEGLLGCDGVSFHVGQYRDNFVGSARQLSGARSVGFGPEGSVMLRHRTGETAVSAVPIGIDVEDFERIARKPEVEARARRIRDCLGGCRMLFSADRLDYTKGIEERLAILERFFETNPDAVGRVVLVQVVVPSRHQVEEYRMLKREIDRKVGRINGLLGREGWMPVHYRYRALDREELVAHYRAADVLLVTPLRDGMNLVASEFAASRVDGHGALVVSEFAGIAERSPGALLVNPYDVDGCASEVRRALEMDPEEQRTRMAQLRERVRANPLRRWVERCLESGRRDSPRGSVRTDAPGLALPDGCEPVA